jgi:hypothetical protein
LLSERRFAGAAKANQRDTPRPVVPRLTRYPCLDPFGDGGQIRLREPPEQIDDAGHGGRTTVRARQEFDDRQLEDYNS